MPGVFFKNFCCFLFALFLTPCFSQNTILDWEKALQQKELLHQRDFLFQTLQNLARQEFSTEEKRQLLPRALALLESIFWKNKADISRCFSLVQTHYPQEPTLEYLWATQLFPLAEEAEAKKHLILANDQKSVSLFTPQEVLRYQSRALTAWAQYTLLHKKWKESELRLQVAKTLFAENEEAQKLLASIPILQQKEREELFQKFKFAVESENFNMALTALADLGELVLDEVFRKTHFSFFCRSIEVFAPQFSPDEVDIWFSLIHKMYPQEPILEYLWVNMLCGYARYSEAQHHMIQANDQRIHSLFPTEEVRKHQATALTSLAICNLEYAEWELANLRVIEALKRDPENVRAYILLARMYSLHKDWKTVLYYFHKAHQIDASQFYASHYMLYGKALITQNLYQKALEIVQEGLQKFPDFADLYMMQAELLLVFQRQIEGYLSYQMAYFFSQAYSEMLQTRTKILLDAGKRAKSFPQNPASQFVIYFEEAVSHLLQDPQKSLQAIQRCEQLWGQSHLILHLIRGIALEQLGELDSAIDIYKRQIESSSFFIPAHLRLFKCYWKQKKWVLMESTLNRALETGDKDNFWIAQVYFVSLLDESHYRVKFYKAKELSPLQKELRQVIYVHFEEWLQQLGANELETRENALLKLQGLFRMNFGYQSQSSLEKMNQAIEIWKQWLPTVQDYLIYSVNYQALIVDEDAYNNGVPPFFWHQVPEEKKKTWPKATPEQKKYWIEDMKNFLGRSRPFLPQSPLPVYLVPNID